MLSTRRTRARFLPPAVIDRIHERLRATGRIPADLARETGLSQAGLGRILNRQRGTTPETIARIAAALQMTREELFVGVPIEVTSADSPGYGRLGAAPVRFYGLVGELVQLGPLSSEEDTAVQRVLRAIRDHRGAGRGENDAGGGAPRAGDPS